MKQNNKCLNRSQDPLYRLAKEQARVDGAMKGIYTSFKVGNQQYTQCSFGLIQTNPIRQINIGNLEWMESKNRNRFKL